MKIDVGRDGPAAFRCDIHLEGIDDPPYIRIFRGDHVVAEIACGCISDAETMAREVENARRLEKLPRLLADVLKEMAGDFAGVPEEGHDPVKRRQLFADGFVAAIRADEPSKGAKQTWLHGYKNGRMILEQANSLALAWRDGFRFPHK